MKLLDKIQKKISQSGHITFDDYMEYCLYTPNLGYYNNKNISLEPSKSDFITGPEVSSIYTDSIVNFYKKYKNFQNIENIIEFGAGSGSLAYNFLEGLDEKSIPKKYYIIEKSDHLKEQQKNKIKKLPNNLSSRVEWLDDLKKIDNAFLIANEVLDAIPSKIFFKEKDNIYEKVIKYDNNLYFSKIKCNPVFQNEIKNIEKRIKRKFPNYYTFEVNFIYEKFLKNIYKNTKNFIFLIIDYGYGENEFYHPEKFNGTIQFYKKHKKIYDCLSEQGNFDISISVDFSRIKRISELSNVQLLSFTSQTEFLLKTGVLENSSKIQNINERSNILKTLLFPTDMGESFKIMLLCDHKNNNFLLDFKDYRHQL